MAKKFSNPFANLQSNQINQPESPSADLQNELLRERLDAETSKTESAFDPFDYEKVGVGASQEDILMGQGEKLGRSLVAGTGDVMEQVVDLSQLAYNYLTPLNAIEKGLGLDFSKNMFDWLEENTAGQLQEYAVKYKAPGTENFKWSDLGTADFWSTDFARQVPNLLTMMAGGAGLAKGAGNLMTRMASKSIARGGALAAEGALASKTIGLGGKVIGRVGGKGLGRLFAKSEGVLGLSTTGQAVAGLAAGSGMNLVDGGIVAGMAYDRALEEFADSPDKENLAGQVAANIFIDNTKWMAVDAVSWAFTFGGGSKLLMPKAIQKMGNVKNSFGKRAVNVLANATAGSAAGAAVAGAATFGEEGMSEAMKKGAVAGLGAGLLPGGRGVKAAAMLAPEGIEEMFQETYQEWIEKKAFNEARGEEDKTPSYWDFYSSDEARRTKAVSLVSGIAGGTVGGYTNLINDIADRNYENDKRIDAITSIMARSTDAETTYEKTSAMYDMVSQAVIDDNQSNLEYWINSEAAKEDGSVDDKLKNELLTFMQEQTKAYEKIGTGVDDITKSEKNELFYKQALLAKNNAEYLEQQEIYNEQKAELEKEISDIRESSLSAVEKEQAVVNLNQRIQSIDDKFNVLTENLNLINNEIQKDINSFTTKVISNSKDRAAGKEKNVKNTLKNAAKGASSFGKGIKEVLQGIVDGVKSTRNQKVNTEGENAQQNPSAAPENYFKDVVNEVVSSLMKDKDKDTDILTEAQLQELVVKSFNENNITESSTNEDIDNNKAKIEESLSKNYAELVKGFQETQTQKAPVTEKKTEEAPVTEEKTESVELKLTERQKNDIANYEAQINRIDSILKEEKDTLTQEEKNTLEKNKKSYQIFIEKIKKRKPQEGEIAVEKTEKETTKEAKKKAKSEKKKYKSKWYSPARILEARKERKKREKQIKEAVEKYNQKKKENNIHYVYALKDAGYSNNALITLAKGSEMFGEAGTSAFMEGVVYASYGPEFAKIVKHEYGHKIYHLYKDTPLVDSIKEIIVGDNKILRNTIKTYPELVIFDTPLGRLTIEEIIESNYLKKLISTEDPTIIEDIDKALSAINTNRIYTNESEQIARKLLKTDLFTVAPMSSQDLLIEEAFANILENEEINIASVIGGSVSNEKSIQRKGNLLMEKIRIPKKATDEQKLEILKALNEDFDDIDSIEDALALVRKQSKIRENLHNPYKSVGRIMRFKPKKTSLDNIAKTNYNSSEQINDIISKNKNEYDEAINDIISVLAEKKNITREEFENLLRDEADRLLIYHAYNSPDVSQEVVNYIDRFGPSKMQMEMLAGAFATEIIAEGTIGENIISKALRSAKIIDEKSDRILLPAEIDENEYSIRPDSNDNPLITEEVSSISKVIDAFVAFAYSPEGRVLIEKSEDFTGKLYSTDPKTQVRIPNESIIKRNLRKEFRRALVDRGEVVSVADYINSITNPKTPLLKFFKEFVLAEYKKSTGTVFFSNSLLVSIARGIHHEQASNVVENRDILYYKEDSGRVDFDFNLSEFETFAIDSLVRDNYNLKPNEGALRSLSKKDRVSLAQLMGALGVNTFVQSNVENYVDFYEIKNVFTVDYFGKKIKVKDLLNKILTYDLNNKNAQLDKDLFSISKEAVIRSRDLNQTTLVDMAALETKTSLLNKTSSLYEVFSSTVKHINKPIKAVNEKTKQLAENSTLEYLINELGITPRLSASSGTQVTTSDGVVKGDSYINMSPTEILVSDILRYFGEEGDSYQMPIMVFAEKSRRYNVTSPKYKELESVGGSKESDFVEKLAETISKARYSSTEENPQGKKVSNLFEISTGTTVKDRIINKNELKKQVEFVKDLLKRNSFITEKLEQNLDKKITDQVIEDFIITTALNKFSAQETLVAEHKDRKDAIDYTKRSTMAIARRRPVFENLEVIVTPDIYYNPNVEKAARYITEDDLKKLKEEKEDIAKGYKIVDDSQSLMLPEDMRLLNQNVGVGTDYGSVFKTVYSGRDTRVDGVESGDLYLKHNTVIASDKYVQLSAEKGYTGLAKLRAIMRARKIHIQNKYGVNAAIIAVSQSGVKSNKSNPLLKPLDVRTIKLTDSDIRKTFAKSKNEDVSNIDKVVKNIIKAEEKVSNIPLQEQTLSEYFEKRDEDFGKTTNEGEIYKGFDASKFGIQNILESKRNETSSTTPIQLLSNYLQAVPEYLKKDVSKILSAYTKATELNSDEQLKNLKEELGEMIDPKWAGNPMSYLIQQGLINLPNVQAKLQEVISKSIITNSTKLRGPGGIGFESSPYGMELKSRVPAIELFEDYVAQGKLNKDFLSENSQRELADTAIVSEIILPKSMQKNFKVGDVVTATRIPADKLSMSQVYVIKDFLDKDGGQAILTPEANSSIKGSDKDGDSLFIDGKYSGKNLSEFQVQYNDYISKSVDFLTNPEMDFMTSLSLEGVETKADELIKSLEDNNVSVPTMSDDILTMQFDEHSLQNNLEIRNILGVCINAFRDTNYLSFHNVSLKTDIVVDNKELNTFNDSADGSEVQFISELVQLILDNPSKLKVFSLGINNVVIKDLVILARMGLDAETALKFVNSKEFKLKYQYTNDANTLKGEDVRNDYYSPEFKVWLSSQLNTDNVNEYLNEPKNKGKIEEQKSQYNLSTLPDYRAGKKYNLSSKQTKRIAGIAKADSNDIYKMMKILEFVNNDISALSDLLNVYNTNPQSDLEINARLTKWENAKNNSLIVDYNDLIKTDPIIFNRKDSLDRLSEAYQDINSISNPVSSDITLSLSKIFKFDKAYKSKNISDTLVNNMFDEALSSVIDTNLSEAKSAAIIKGILDFYSRLNEESPLKSVLEATTENIFISPGIVSRATTMDTLNELREFIENEIGGETIEVEGKKIPVAEAIVTFLYNKPNSTGQKSRLKNATNILSLMPKSLIKKIANASSETKMSEAAKLSKDDILNIAESNISSLFNLYQDNISVEGSGLIKTIDGKTIVPISFKQVTPSVKGIIDALYEVKNNRLEFSLEKVKSIVDGGVTIMPVLIDGFVNYIDLQSIVDGKPTTEWIKKKDNVTPEPSPGKDSALTVAKMTRGNRPVVKQRKVISNSEMRSFNKDMTFEEYSQARNISNRLTKNQTINSELKKEFLKLKTSKEFIDKFESEIFNNLDTYSMDDLMYLASEIVSMKEIEQLAKDTIVKEISIKLAQKARDSQMALNPEGYANADEGDVSFMKKWLMSNDVDMNNPDVQAMTRIIEQQYFRFTQEYAKQARPIKVIAKSLKSDFYKKVGPIEYVKLWLKGELNRELYKNIYNKVTDSNGNEFIVLNKDLSGLSKNEKEFHSEFSRVMELVSDSETGYDGSVPYHTINSHEAFMRQGLYGAYLSSQGMESHLNSVPVYANDPITGQNIKRTFLEWKDLYSNSNISKSNFNNLQNFRKIKSKAEEIMKSGVDEDGQSIQFDNTAMKMLLQTEETTGYIAQGRVNLKEFASYDLETIALKTLRTHIFNHGSDSFQGFRRLGFLIDGVIEYNEMNPNIRQYITEVYKKYIAKQGTKKKKTTKEKAMDAFVMFTSLKVLGPWNIGIPIGNILIGKYQQLRSTGLKQFLKGEARFINPKNFRKNSAIIRNYVSFDMSMYENFYTMQEKTPFDQIADLIMLPMEQSEKYIQGAGFLSFLTEEEYNAFKVDENGTITNNPLSDDRIAQIMENVRKEQGKGYNVTNQRLTGMYASTRLLFQFKKYLPTLFTERFGKERIDRYGNNQIGSVTAVRSVVSDYMSGKITRQELLNQPEHIKTGVRKWRNGVFLSLAIALMAGWDDEDDWLDDLSRDSMMTYDVTRFKYKFTPAAYYNIKSMID